MLRPLPGRSCVDASAQETLPTLICYDDRRPIRSDLSPSSRLFFSDEYRAILQRLLRRSPSIELSITWISKHRLNDGVNGCLRSSDDEQSIDYCRSNFSDHFFYLTGNDCLRREHFYNGKVAPNCHDGSNQIYPFQCLHRDDRLAKCLQ